MAAGRIIVAPAHLPDGLQQCISQALLETLSGPELQQAAALAGLSLAPAGPRETLADLRTGDEQLSGFEPLVRAAMQQARQ
jgi:tripartite-type tricarboxylate transporter receptor subunit TctC